MIPFDRPQGPILTTAAGAAEAVAAAALEPEACPPPQGQTPVKPWGSPMSVQEPAQNQDRSSPDNENSWGRTVNLAWSDRPQEVARVQLATSQALTVSIAVNVAPGEGTYQPVPAGPTVDLPCTVWARVTLGSGSGSTTYQVRADAFVSVPVVGTYASVAVYIGDLDGNPVSGIAFATLPDAAQVNVQVARGVRCLPQQATTFASDFGASFAIGNSPQRVASIAAHLGESSSGTEIYLQLFDSMTAPTAGDVPYLEWAMGEEPEESAIGDLVRFTNPLGLSQGAWFVTSTTSGTYTSASVDVFVALERVLL